MDISSLNPALTPLTLQQSSLASLLGTTTTATTTDPFASIVSGEQQLMTLSAMGQTADHVTRAAEASGNAQVIAGTQQALATLFSLPESTDSIMTLNAASTLANQHPDTFNAVFSTVNALSQQGMTSAISPYLSAANAAYAQSGTSSVDALNTAVNQILAPSTASNATTTTQQLTSLFSQYATSNTGTIDLAGAVAVSIAGISAAATANNNQGLLSMLEQTTS